MGKLPRARIVAEILALSGIIAACTALPFNSPMPAGTKANTHTPVSSTAASILPLPTSSESHTIDILVDDFNPQPNPGESLYFFNRLEGDRGARNNSILAWGEGQVTATVSPGNSWGGFWMSLNHPIREGLSINFSAVLPEPILSAYQSRITGISLQIVGGTSGLSFRLELKDGEAFRWKEEITLTGGEQDVHFTLPALGNINQLVFVLDHASAGQFVVLNRASFSVETKIIDTAFAAFVWSYGMLLNNWNPATGLVRDKAKDASGEFDAIQATGNLAAATAVAEQVGIIDRADATEIVQAIGDALLTDLPRFQGLWPHWVKASSTGELAIVENTEWSSVDTAIAALGLLEAQSGLGLDTSGVELMLQEIQWDVLTTPNGISHGFSYSGDPIPYTWDVFGGESWLIEMMYSAVTGRTAPLAYPTAPTANGSGFIDELAWLFVQPPAVPDYWETDWNAYRSAAANAQISFYPEKAPTSCFSRLGLFGLSAGETPAPWMVDQQDVYQAFGVGGAFTSVNDGAALGNPVVTPHYSAMIASLHPAEVTKMWDWLIANGFFSPLTNVESLMFASDGDCDPESMVWNQLKGSWNLSLQTLGWGRFLAERDGLTPILWQAAKKNPFLHKGYLLLAMQEDSPTPTFASPTNTDIKGTRLWAGNSLGGRSVDALAIDPNLPASLYAGTDAGVYKSTDAGESWNAVGLSGIECLSLTINPTTPMTVYAGTESGVYKSIDSGMHWSAAGLSGTMVFSIAIDPLTTSILFAGTGYGSYKSSNGGAKWSLMSTAKDQGPAAYVVPVKALVINPGKNGALYAGTPSYTYPSTMRYVRGSIYKSTDGGEVWTEVFSDNLDVIALAIDPIASDTLYAGTNAGIIKSTDGGDHWIYIGNGLSCSTAYVFSFDPTTPSTMYVGTNCGVFITTNRGENWSSLVSALTKNDILSLAIDSASAALYVGTKANGLFVIR